MGGHRAPRQSRTKRRPAEQDCGCLCRRHSVTSGSSLRHYPADPAGKQPVVGTDQAAVGSSPTRPAARRGGSFGDHRHPSPCPTRLINRAVGSSPGHTFNALFEAE
jgi:hypothetical protein